MMAVDLLPSSPTPMTPRGFPIHLWALAALYCLASLVHFTHNAEYIAFYPNMPGWLTRETVYLAWLVVFAVGVAGAGLALAGYRVVGALALVVYGALGLFGLGHYSLALCAQHTLAMNATIWFEVATGVGLAAAAGWFALSARRS
jgi:hypothetical protein